MNKKTKLLLFVAIIFNVTAFSQNLLKDINPGTAGANSKFLSELNGYIYFHANVAGKGEELWKTDGTLTGTTLVKDIRLGASGSLPFHMYAYNGYVYFWANDANGAGVELWRTDGTAVGTAMFKDINPANSSFPRSFIESNGVLYFVALNNTKGYELWKTDGTITGTVLVKDVCPGACNGFWTFVSNLLTDPVSFDKAIVVNGISYFAANNGSDGYELWRSDGTDLGTYMVKNINPTISGLNVYTEFTIDPINNIFYFTATETSLKNEVELWRSDGSTKGTYKVKEINPTNAYGASHPIYFKGKIFFRGNNGTQNELWVSDGTKIGTKLFMDINPTGSSNPFDFSVAGGKLYFRADNGVNGQELWVSDGTVSGTKLVKDIFPGSTSSSIEIYKTSSNSNLIFFKANNGTNGKELWQSNGTNKGTFMVIDAEPGFAGSLENGGGFTSLLNITSNNRVFWSTNTAKYGIGELFVYTPKTCKNTTSTDIQVACNDYTWRNGVTYTESNNTATDTVLNSAGCDSVITLNLTINTVNSSIRQMGTLLTANEIGASYQWLYCPEMIAINRATNQSYSIAENRGYAVIVSKNGCSDTSNCYPVGGVGIIESNFVDELFTYPNPSNGNFILDFERQLGLYSLKVYNNMGQLVFSKNNTSQKSLDLHFLPQGYYHLEILLDKKRFFTPIIIN